MEARIAPKQIRAIQITRNLAEQLLVEHPEIAEPSITNRGYKYIAHRYLPGIYRKHPKIAQRAVGFALEALLGTEEREALRTRRFEAGGRIAKRRKLGALNPAYDAFRTYWGKKAARMHAKKGTGIIHDPVLRKQALEARGTYLTHCRKTAYGEVDEARFILLAKQSGAYDHYGGWLALTDHVNRLYHHERTSRQIRAVFNYWRNK